MDENKHSTLYYILKEDIENYKLDEKRLKAIKKKVFEKCKIPVKEVENADSG